MSAKISISGEAHRRTRTRRWFPQEYKDQVLAWYFDSGKPVALAAEELNLSESTLRGWIRRATRASTESASAMPGVTPVEGAEMDMEIAWHGEPEEPYVPSLHHQANATWVYSPARLEALLAGAPAIAEVAYKLGVSESVVRLWARSAADELDAAAAICDDDPPSSDVARELEPETILDLEPETTLDLQPETTLDREPEAISDPQPEATLAPEPITLAPEPITLELEPITSEPEEATPEPEEATVSAGEPAPPIVSEHGLCTLVWRPPTEGEAALNANKWVHASGWTPSQARSAVVALLGTADCEAGIEVEFLQVPRHRFGGRIHVRARRRTGVE